MRIMYWSSDVCSSDLVRTASIAQLVTVALNMVLAPVLIFGWGSGHPLGVAGASLATLISVAIGVIGLLAHVLRRTHFLIADRRAWRPEPRSWSRMVRIRSEEHTSELQSLRRNSYAVFCLQK